MVSIALHFPANWHGATAWIFDHVAQCCRPSEFEVATHISITMCDIVMCGFCKDKLVLRLALRNYIISRHITDLSLQGARSKTTKPTLRGI